MGGWNWGAFLLGWLWAFAHRLWVPGVLGLVPGLNIVMMPVFGLKGNVWARRSRGWASADEFERAQRTWARLGLGVWAVGGALVALTLAT